MAGKPGAVGKKPKKLAGHQARALRSRDYRDAPEGASEETLALWTGLRRGDLAAAQAALAAGADCRSANHCGMSPLLLALQAECGHKQSMELIALLLRSGAPLRDASGHSAAISFAAKFLDGGATSRAIAALDSDARALAERDELGSSLPDPGRRAGKPRI